MSGFDKSITIGPEWFKTVKKDYTDWRFAWVRESAQNSLDAGATEIHATVSLNDDGNTVVRWQDNGCGMDADILESKFMAIGGSDKPFGGTGGFGVAKLILAFAQNDYTIRSQDIEAKGSGASYSLTSGLDGLDYYNGLILTVTMDENEVDYMKEKIRRWVRFTTTSCDIFLNGDKLETLHMHKPKQETEWCKIYTHNQISSEYGYCIRVRMNQQYMFDVYTSVQAHICVDLNGTDSQEYLTSNRDGLNWKWHSKLQKLVEEIYENPNKIKETCDHITVYRGTDGRIDLDTRPKRKGKLTLNTSPRSNDRVASFTNKGEPKQITPVALSAPRTYREVEKLIDGFDILIVNKTNKLVPDKWLPGSMTKTAYKLINRWIRLAQVVGGILGRTEEVSIGLVFCHSVRAMYKFHDEHKHMLLLNPVDISETRYTNHWRNDTASFFEMVCVMVHEMTHIEQGNHNDSFARDITYAMAKVMARSTLLNNVRKETA